MSPFRVVRTTLANSAVESIGSGRVDGAALLELFQDR